MPFARLLRHQTGVDAILLHERRVAAAFDNPAVVEHDDAVAADNARQTVRQRQRRASLHQSVQCFLYCGFVLGVDCRQRLIKNKDRRVAKQRTRNGHPLALTTRELDALLANDGVVALRKRHNKVVDVGGPGGFLNVIWVSIRPPNADIFINSAVKQERVLINDRDHAADLCERKFAQIVPADADTALVRVIESQQQSDDRGFTAPRGADDTDPRTCSDMKIETIVNISSRPRIPEMNIIEIDRRSQSNIKRGRSSVGNKRRLIENPIDALSRRHPDHALMQNSPQFPHRPINLDAQHQNDK